MQVFRVNQPHQKQQSGSSKRVPLVGFSCLTMKNGRECVCEHRGRGVWFFKGRAGSWSRSWIWNSLWGEAMEEAGRNPQYKVTELSSGVQGHGLSPIPRPSSRGFDVDEEAGEPSWVETRVWAALGQPGASQSVENEPCVGPEVSEEVGQGDPGRNQPRHFLSFKLGQLQVGRSHRAASLRTSNAPESVPRGRAGMRRLCPWETAPGLRWLDVLRSPFYEPNSYTSPNLEKHQPPSWRRRLLVVSSNCHETSGILCKETRARLHVPSPPPESPPYWPCPSASWEQCLSDLRRCLSGYSPHSAPNQTTHNSHVVLFF